MSRASVEERFWSKVDKTDTCWLWTASKSQGYGQFWDGKKMQYAHRVAYQFSGGIIPRGLVIDHLCRITSCVNPKHLEVVTHKENILRGIGPAARNARKTHCDKGHSFSGDNLYYNSRNQRVCKICEIERFDEYIKFTSDKSNNEKMSEEDYEYIQTWAKKHRIKER